MPTSPTSSLVLIFLSSSQVGLPLIPDSVCSLLIPHFPVSSCTIPQSEALLQHLQEACSPGLFYPQAEYVCVPPYQFHCILSLSQMLALITPYYDFLVYILPISAALGKNSWIFYIYNNGM